MSIPWLVAFTVIEIVALVAVLAFFAIVLTRRLQAVSGTLAKIAFGVRAVEVQVDRVGPGVRRWNEALEKVARSLERVHGGRNG